MKTYLQTPTSDPPLQGKGALAKHTLVCHHQDMFGCRENERKRREKREKCDLKMKSCTCTERLKVRVTKSYKLAYIANPIV